LGKKFIFPKIILSCQTKIKENARAELFNASKANT
jgi:hypothetical protein